jgi:hypothetical protein
MFEEPTISISTDSGKTYTAATVGIKGVETGKDWYWSSNDQIITQDFAGTRLTSTGRLKIEYYGIYQIVLTSANFLEIVDRQSVEGGGSGLVEAVKDDPLVTTEAAGIAEANAILDHYAQIGIKVEYTTLRSGIEVGTLQHITSTIHNLDDDFLITQVEKCPMFHDDSMVLNDIVQYRCF